MKRFTPVLVLTLLLFPALLFAQDVQSRQRTALKEIGLTDTQITQVLNLQTKMESTIRTASVHLRLLRAQIDEALLPARPDMQKVNSLIDREAAQRAEMEKALVADRVELRRIVGDENFQKLTRLRRSWFSGRFFDRGGPGRRLGDGQGAGPMGGNQMPPAGGDGPFPQMQGNQ